MPLDVHCEADLDRYEQVFDNPGLNLLFSVANGRAYFLQFCDPTTLGCIQATCFAVHLEVQDFLDPPPEALPEPVQRAEADTGDNP